MEKEKILTKDHLYERIPFLKHYEDVTDGVQHALDNIKIDPKDIEIYAFKYSHKEEDVNVYLEQHDSYVTVPSITFVSTLGYTGAELKNDSVIHVFELTNIIEPDKPDYMDDVTFKKTFGEWTKEFYQQNSFKETISKDDDEGLEGELENILKNINGKLFFMEETLTNMNIDIYK